MLEPYDADALNPTKPPILPLLGFTSDEVIEAFTTTLFHPFEAEYHVDRQINLESMMSLEDIQPAKDRALVVGRAPSIQFLSFFVDVQFKGLGIPSITFACLVMKRKRKITFQKYLSNIWERAKHTG